MNESEHTGQRRVRGLYGTLVYFLARSEGVGIAVFVRQQSAHERLPFGSTTVAIHREGEVTEGTDAQRRGAVGVVEIARVDDVRVIDLDEIIAGPERDPEGDRQGETDTL